ncbi:hypothetical protein PRIPAC_85482 [Pristionchus pacificus]|uniref:Uncharacterized protein n=1 Tax=Pristionchus pacificus TaxID=54126 RepID=A0A2A6BU43_PRIPA|nr:hypothetical protein PRIPAC_85482 [Pristionchus pacificus]|eukprot:PDM69424.1 hypothetical protein PRIPAC_44520 [Pristionchus pacificus]
MSELENCLRDGFDGPTLANRLTIGIPMSLFTAVGLQMNIVLWRIITIQRLILYTNFTIALDRFLMFATPRIYEHVTGSKHYILVLLPYSLIFIIIFRKRMRLGSEMSLRNRDFVFVLQFLIITIIQLAGNLLFYVNFSDDVIVESLIRLSSSCCTTYSNPIVMFAFHERIRRSYLIWGRRLWLFERDLLENGGRPKIRTRSTTNIL